ncbi:MAG: hypothetical protein HUU46_19685 [Candidatus Hydrogenedentes bacterium]|nr:hypothetical protein [Candidatus Hydrogenedentota bacterium]
MRQLLPRYAPLVVLAIALVTGFSISSANEYCARCTDTCVGIAGGGCELYFGRPDVWNDVNCPPNSDSSEPCDVTKTVGCYTTYRVCSEGYCDMGACVGEGGCSTYTYPYIDAGTNPSGPTQCTPQ